MTEREALKLALPILESYASAYSDGYEVIATIKEVLAQPERTWVGLTDEEIMDMYNEPRSDAEMITFGREVEAALKEKNT